MSKMKTVYKDKEWELKVFKDCYLVYMSDRYCPRCKSESVHRRKRDIFVRRNHMEQGQAIGEGEL